MNMGDSTSNRTAKALSYIWATEETYSTVSRLVFEIPNLKFFLIWSNSCRMFLFRLHYLRKGLRCRAQR